MVGINLYKLKKTLLLTIFIVAVAAIATLLSACDSILKDDSELRAEGYVRATLDCNGGKIGIYTKRFLYGMPGSKILEPGAESALSQAVNGVALEVEGWYFEEKDSEGNYVFDPDKKWNFKSDKLPDHDITLVANWIPMLQFVAQGVVLEETAPPTDPNVLAARKNVYFYVSNYATDKILYSAPANLGWADYTQIGGFYEDEDLTVPLSLPLEHKGDTIEHIFYTRLYIGKFKLVTEPRHLSGIGELENLLILNDINMANASPQEPWVAPDKYSGIIRGDGGVKTISGIDFRATRKNTDTRLGLFGILNGATLEDVAFVGCDVTFTINNTSVPIYIGLLAGEITGGTSFSNFSISGTLTVNRKVAHNHLLTIGWIWGKIDSGLSTDGLSYPSGEATINTI